MIRLAGTSGNQLPYQAVRYGVGRAGYKYSMVDDGLPGKRIETTGRALRYVVSATVD